MKTKKVHRFREDRETWKTIRLGKRFEKQRGGVIWRPRNCWIELFFPPWNMHMTGIAGSLPWSRKSNQHGNQWQTSHAYILCIWWLPCANRRGSLRVHSGEHLKYILSEFICIKTTEILHLGTDMKEQILIKKYLSF